MSDLKIIDELLCQERLRLGSWNAVREYSHNNRRALERLGAALSAGEMDYVTLDLADYLRGRVHNGQP